MHTPEGIANDAPRLDGPGLFVDRVAAEFAYSLRHGAPLSLLVVEPLEEGGLRALSDAEWRDSVRKGDVVARIGEHRIAVIAPYTSQAMAARIAARLRARTSGAIRVGAATMTPATTYEGPGALLRAAELALA